MKRPWDIEINTTRLIMLITLLCAVLGVGIFRSTAILFTVATLLAAPLVIWVTARLASSRLKVARRLPDTAMVGDVVTVHLSVSNDGFWPAFLVHLRPVVAPKTYTRHRLMSRLTDRVADDLSLAYEVARGDEELVVPVLRRGARFEGEIFWKMKRRGVYELPGAGAGALDPLGFSDGFPVRSPASKFIVLPRPMPLPQISIAGGIEGEPQPRRGGSVADATDLHGVRPYRSGEPIRRIHWRATARTGQLHVVEWEEEMASDLIILIDVEAKTNAGSPNDNTFEASIVAAASVASRLLDQGRRVRIFWWRSDGAAPEGVRLDGTESRHQGGTVRVLEALARLQLQNSPRANLVELSRSVRLQVGPYETVLILSSDQADVMAALGVWGRASGARALVFEANSFVVATPKIGAFLPKTLAGQRATKAARRDSNKSVAPSLLARNVRTVRRDDSLAAAFKGGWK